MSTDTKENVSVYVYNKTKSPWRVPRLQRYSRWWMTFILVLSDVFSLVIAGVIAVCLRAAIGGQFQLLRQILNILPLLALNVGVYAWRGLYPAVGLSPVEELRRLTVSTSVIFLLVTGFAFWMRTAEIYSRLIFAFAWLFALVLVPFSRVIFRGLAMRMGIWGEPVAVVGYGPQGQRVVDFLSRNLRFGLRPVAVIDGLDAPEENNAPIPVIRLASQDFSTITTNLSSIRTLVLITSEIPKELQDAIVDQQRFGFRRLILIPNLHWVGSVGVIPYDLEGFLGLEVRQNLLSDWQQAFKRLIDIGLVFTVGFLILPVAFLIGLLIWLESRENVLYYQERVGKGGSKFMMWKFRTMVVEADQVLNEYLTEHPESRREWEEFQKIKNDPRVTRLGNFLRKSSLDELPQLWNVLKGEMSFVGPRPIVEEEIKHYDQGYKLYRQVRPGITGLWQVSGRSNVGYDARVRFDEYYVRNWSIWLDIHIMLRTFWAVMRREGAY